MRGFQSNMEMETIHVHKRSFRREYAMLLLLIPSIVFSLVLALFVAANRSENRTDTHSEQVLKYSTMNHE